MIIVVIVIIVAIFVFGVWIFSFFGVEVYLVDYIDYNKKNRRILENPPVLPTASQEEALLVP